MTKSRIAGAWCVLYVDTYPYMIYTYIYIFYIQKSRKYRELHWLYCINSRKVRGNGEDQDLSMGVKDPWVLGHGTGSVEAPESHQRTKKEWTLTFRDLEHHSGTPLSLCESLPKRKEQT